MITHVLYCSYYQGTDIVQLWGSNLVRNHQICNTFELGYPHRKIAMSTTVLPRNFPVRAGFREEGEGHVGRGGHRWRAQSKGGSGCRGVLSADVPLCPCDR